MIKIRPFLKWAGGKYRCLDMILASLPKGDRLIEPFTGSGVVFLNTDFPNYLLAEGNADLVNLYLCLQKEGPSFIESCEGFFSYETNQEKNYYDLRKKFNESTDKRERSLIFLYLNRHGYNGLCRYNQRGGYNVPFGRYKKPYFPLNELHAFHLKTQTIEIIESDFKDTFLRAKKGDIIYCDPPYAPLSKTSNFSSYTSKGFGEKEQIILVNLAKEAASLGATVIISNHDTPFTRHHYKGSTIRSFPVKRSISCNTHSRVDVRELIAIFR